MEATTRKVVSSLLKPRKKGEEAKTVLRVTINKAEHLPAMDLNGLSDPFCRIVYDGKSQKTSVIRESLDPEWNESFDFEYKQDLSLLVEVYDWDLVGTNDYMGSVVITMSAVTHAYSSSWLTLKDDKGLPVPFARINVGVQMMTESEAGIAPAGKNVSLMSAVVGNLKPILNNIFRLLYVVVRPILLQLILVRKLFIDWETPLQTIVASIVFLYVWYYQLIITTVLVMVWWGLTKRLWTYRLFRATYVALDPDMKEKDMLKAFKDTKIELKYGRDDPISEDVQLVARLTGKISDKALELQAFFNWQRKFVPTLVAWAVLLLLAVGHSFVPWRFIFYWLFRIGLVVGWAVATIVVPVLRIFPTATIKIKRFFTSRGFLSHIKPKYTSAEGIVAHAEMSRVEKDLLLNVGVTQLVRGERELVERGQWSDLFFYPVTAVLRTGHTTHVKTFMRPANVLISRFASLNPGFDSTRYVMRHLHSVTTMQGGKVVVFDVPSVRLEFQQNPNLAFHFYRWLACSLTKKNDRTLVVKQSMTEAAAEADAVDASIAGAGLDPDEVAPPKQDILQLRAVEKRKQQVLTLREKFGVSADEVVLHIAGDVFRRRLGKKYYGNVFVTMRHLAFLPSTISQQNERWIAEADEVETAFVDKNGALEILFAGSEVRHLYHEDKNVLNEIVSHLNHMKTAAESKRSSLLKHAVASPENSPPVMKRQNIRAAVAKTLQKSASRGSLARGLSLRGSVIRRTTVPDAVVLPLSSSPPPAAEAGAFSQSSKTATAAAVAAAASPEDAETRGGRRSEEPGVAEEGAEGGEEEEETAGQADLTEQAIASAAGESKQGLVAAGTPLEWKHVRITDLLDAPLVRKLLDKRMKREFAAGSQILKQDVSREVAIHVLWKGSAKAVRFTPGKPDLFIGYVNEGSLFGEMAYLLEANSSASVVAVSDCTVYSLPGPWLDGLFDMDRLFGAQFFEFVCLIMFERSVLSEALLDVDKTSSPLLTNDDESEGL